MSIALTLNSIKFRNYLSYGNAWTELRFDNGINTFISGENHDTGSKNGCGKCVLGETLINIRNKKTGEIISIPIGEFYDMHEGT
jgi:ABC-type dipeptide/oligopeptide/nickel transport system ATPase subunit